MSSVVEVIAASYRLAPRKQKLVSVTATVTFSLGKSNIRLTSRQSHYVNEKVLRTVHFTLNSNLTLKDAWIWSFRSM